MLLKKEEILEHYITNELFKEEGTLQIKLYELFKVFSSFYILNKQDLKQSADSFYEFLLGYADFLASSTSTPYGITLSLLERFRKSLHMYIYNKFKDEDISSFSRTVCRIFEDRNKHILDVGCGQLPLSSINLGEKFEKVSCMDKDFLVSEFCLKHMNVESIEKYFNEKTEISKYDIVVGKNPCTAIDAMVYICSKYKKPYYIETCNCNIPSNEELLEKYPYLKASEDNYSFYNMPSESMKPNWRQILPHIDPNVRFARNAVHNLDINEIDLNRIRMYQPVVSSETFPTIPKYEREKD